MSRLVLGIDFGSDTARTLIVDAETGETAAEAVAAYPRWAAGLYQDPARQMYRQHPQDYLDAMTEAVRAAASQVDATQIASLAVDATGSTPCPVDAAGTPLALLPGFEEDADAMFHLWKDHTAVAEASEVTRAFRENADGIDYTKYQGPYASEWYWAKMLHTTRTNPHVASAAHAWVEHCDWIPGLLAGETRPERMYRCACTAGHKAYWHSAWGGLPSRRCLESLSPALAASAAHYGQGPRPSTACVGTLTRDWAERLGLSERVRVGGSSLDAHAGAVGAGVNARTLVVNLGTSAVDMLVVEHDALAGTDISWAAGAAEDSIMPGYIGLEAGQAAYGDVYAWFRRLLLWPLEQLNDGALTAQLSDALLDRLQAAATSIPPESIGAVALDWFNGRRYPHVNESAHAALAGLTLGTSAPELFAALVQATAMGQRRILETLWRHGITTNRIVAVGGIAQKSPYAMQVLADTLGRRIEVSRTKQACARGAAMYAAVAAGIHPDLVAAQARMCEGTLAAYVPNTDRRRAVEAAYQKYLHLARATEDI